MAFCPHCGKRTGDQATRCIGCGKEITPAAAGGGPGRFKGTMMMAAPVVGAPAGTPSATEPVEAKPAATDEKPAAREAKQPEQPAAAKPPGGQKRNLSGTMVGGMAAPSLPGPRKQVPSERPTPSAADPGPSATAKTMLGAAPPAKAKPAPADAAPSDPLNQEAAPTPKPAAAPRPATPAPTPVEGALPGDPMAQPQVTPGPIAPRARPAAMEASFSMHDDGDRSSMMWLGIGFVGMLAIAGIGLLAAKLMGLL